MHGKPRKVARGSGQPRISSRKQFSNEGKICRCTLQCDKVQNEEKLKLFSYFHTLCYNEQNEFFFASCIRVSKVLRRYGKERRSRRNYTVFYYVPREDEEVRVCQKTFCDIFKVSPRRLYWLCEKIKVGVPVQDRRGTHNNRPNKILRIPTRYTELTERVSKPDTEEEAYQERTSVEMEFIPEGYLSPEVHLKTEVDPLSLDFEIDKGVHEIKNTVQVKQEPCLLEETTEMKPESELTHDSDVYVKSELTSDMHEDCHEIHTKIEIKEESLYIGMSTKSEEACLKETESEDLLEKKLLPEPTRLDVGSKSCLKPRENDTLNRSTMQMSLTHNKSPLLKPYKCKRCDRCFSQEVNLNKHNLIHEGKRPYSCSTCAKSFTQASYLKQHSSIHCSKKEHKCTVCDKSFTLVSYLKQHNLIHEGKRQYKCPICYKMFIHASNLKQHILIHEGKGYHKCTVCSKSFSRASNLKQHSLIHEGKRQYSCSICDKWFTLPSHLKQHNVVHQDQGQYKCTVCDKTFSRASTLKQHSLIHEGKRQHVCTICDKSFTQASYLKQHSLTHDINRIECTRCDKSFTRLSSLKRHFLNH